MLLGRHRYLRKMVLHKIIFVKLMKTNNKKVLNMRGELQNPRLIKLKPLLTSELTDPYFHLHNF